MHHLLEHINQDITRNVSMGHGCPPPPIAKFDQIGNCHLQRAITPEGIMRYGPF